MFIWWQVQGAAWVAGAKHCCEMDRCVLKKREEERAINRICHTCCSNYHPNDGIQDPLFGGQRVRAALGPNLGSRWLATSLFGRFGLLAEPLLAAWLTDHHMPAEPAPSSSGALGGLW